MIDSDRTIEEIIEMFNVNRNKALESHESFRNSLSDTEYYLSNMFYCYVILLEKYNMNNVKNKKNNALISKAIKAINTAKSAVVMALNIKEPIND